MYFFRYNNNLPEIYSNKLDNKVIPEIGLRICALRETFEETGLLLKCEKSINGIPKLSQIIPNNVEEWRKKVISNPENVSTTYLHYVLCIIWMLICKLYYEFFLKGYALVGFKEK